MEPVFIDERQDVQKKTFTKWINAHLSKSTCPPVKDLFVDLRDGHKLLALLEVLTNVQYKRERGDMRVHHINNLNKTLQVLQENGVKLLNISSEDIVAGNTKLTLGLIWIIALSFDGQRLVNSQAVNGLEKSLLNWVRQFTGRFNLKINDFSTSWSDGLAFLYVLYGNVPEFDLNAAVKSHPIARLRLAFDLAARNLQIDPLLDPEDVNTNKPDKKSILMYVMCLYHAIDARKMEQGSIHDLVQHFGSNEEIQLLDEKEEQTEEDVEDNHQNTANIVGTFQKPFHVGNITALDEISLGKSTDDLNKLPSPIQRSATFTISKNVETTSTLSAGPDKSEQNFPFFIESQSRPMSTATNASIEIGSYQNAIEVVLTLLLEAEDVLSKDLAESTDLAIVKEQFQEHEDFMIKLAEYQQYVGGALEEGARLMSESQINPGLSLEDQNEIKHQMFLLNERWETLRIRALSIQTKIHTQLAKVQLEKIEELKFLLTNTEDRISRMAEVDASPDILKQQIEEHQQLERSLEEQKHLVECLSNLVVIVNDESFNDLEDKLAGLGERWSHVVKWTKTRYERLQVVSLNWNRLNRDYSVICKWMDNRESDLKAMEGKEVTEIGNVMKRMNDLHYCAMDLDVLAKHLVELEVICQQLLPSAGTIAEKLENLGDRCEALKQIVEIQQTRIERMGFTIKPSSKDKIDRPESWIDFQYKIVQTCLDDHQDGDLSPQSNKKRKLHMPENVRQLKGKIQEMNIFVNDAEAKLDDFKQMNLKQQATLLATLAEDIKEKIDEYASVKDLLEQCKKEQDINLNVEAQEICDIGSRYDQINFKIEDLQVVHKNDVIKEKLYTNLTAFKLVLADCRDWFKQNSNKASKEDLENRLSYMESLNPEINESKSSISSNPSSDLKEWKRDFDQFFESWIDMRRALSRLIQEINGHNDDDHVNESRQKLEDFINETEETYIVIADLNEMDQNLSRLNDLKDRYNELQALLLSISDKLSQSSENDDLSEVWEKLPNLINERIIKQTTAVENLKHFNNEYEDIVRFLKKIETALCEDIFIVGEVQGLLKMSEKYLEHETEIKKLEIDIISVKNFSEIIVKDSEDDHKHVLTKKVKDLNERYTKIIDLFQKNSKKLHQIQAQTEGILERIDKTELWLNDLEMNTPRNTNAEISNSNELFQIKTKFQTLKETCEQRTIAFRELNESGSEMLLQIDDLMQQKSNEKRYSFLAKQFTKINARWNAVTAKVYNRTALLEHISSQLGEFKTLIVTETGYLDKLEKCLRKSPKNAADAEEIYEELDDLENNIRNHSDERLEKIQEIGGELIDHHILTKSISDEVDRITERWNLLQHQAKQHEQMLQKAVSEAQTSETRILTLQQWIYRVDSILKEHIENDTTMEDLPHDFQRLIEEFEKNEEILKEMHSEIELYHENGKVEAANRLQDQVDLLENRFKTCQDKLNSFTSPQAGFESRLNRALGELRSVERNSCILDVLSAGPSNVQDQFQHCLKMYRTLSEIKGEIETVIKTGRKVCEDKSTKNPKKLGLSIDALKHLYNTLGEHVTQSKNTLEKLLKLTNALNDHTNRIEQWLECQEDPAPQNNNNSSETIETIESYLQQCNNIYDEYKESCEPTYLSDVRSKIDDLSRRVSKFSSNEVVKHLNELKSTLHNLDNISLDSLRTMEKDLEAVETTNSDVQKLHDQVSKIVKDAIVLKTKSSELQNTEIVVVSDTVRQRRARTPSATINDTNEKSNETNGGGNVENAQTTVVVMPDLLPTTFRLAESSSLFSQISDRKIDANILKGNDAHKNDRSYNAQQFSVVEIKESNLTPKMSVRNFQIDEEESTKLIPKIGEIVNTISILESVDTFEPEYVETVHIIDASEASDTDTCSMLDEDEEEKCKRNSNDELEAELDRELESYVCFIPENLSNTNLDLLESQFTQNDDKIIIVEKQKISTKHQHRRQLKERDLLKDSEENVDQKKSAPVARIKRKIAPTLKEILSIPEEQRDSFYSADKENFDIEPLQFSDDEDIPRFSKEMTTDFDSDSDTSRIETPNSSKPDSLLNKFMQNEKTSAVPLANLSPMITYKNSTSLDQRVYEFDKTAKYMIRKLDATREQIEKCDDDLDAIEHLKLSISPDAATLISQGDTLVLETHGKSTELSNTVMKTQSLLREKFREMKHARLPKNLNAQQLVHKTLLKDQQILPENQNLPKEKALNDKKFMDNIRMDARERNQQKQLLNQNANVDSSADDLVQKVLDNVTALMAKQLNNSVSDELTQRLVDVGDRQEDLKLAMDIASQATPSPKAKSTMESLEKAKRELSSHCDAIKLSLANLNRSTEWQYSERSAAQRKISPSSATTNNGIQQENSSESFKKDIDMETFKCLEPHHIKEFIPNLYDRIKFEKKYKEFLSMDEVYNRDLNNIQVEITTEPDLPNQINQITSVPQPNIIFIAPDSQIKINSAEDIVNIPNIELKVILKKYANTTKNLENCDRLNVARAIIHHILVDNLDKKIPREEFLSISNCITDLFPTELAGTYYTAAIKNTPAQGKLYTVYSNYKTILREQNLIAKRTKRPTIIDENSSEPYVPGSFSSKAKLKFLQSGPQFVAASFDKSVLQISDWLNQEQDMLKNQSVEVGEVDAILMAVDKQKNVLRELEFKKPQLDELVHTAENLKTDVNRQQLHNKVTRLREHWDETSQCVLQRKSQLVSMLGDSQRYESKRLEIEAWLTRMESRSEHMGTVATTADVLEAQQKEQKSFHAELHQYKHHIELFSQLTQKLIKVYPTDDTSRIKRMTESVNLRYNNLNNGVINRGKLLHHAVHNLQSFDRTMDKFLAWLSEAESLCENAEQEIDRNPHVLKVSTL